MAKVCCLDLEMNQPSGKIIQIGYVIADSGTGRIFKERSIIVDPKEHLGEINLKDKTVSISDFTGITEEQIKKEGITLAEAYKILVEDISTQNCSRTCLQWGDGFEETKGDHDYLRRELGIPWNEFVFRARAWDIKSFWQIYRSFYNQGVVSGVAGALKILDLKFEGREHNALDDAKNTFRIYLELGKKMTLGDKIRKLI